MTAFKSEIAGLRAIAVAVVILFHLKMPAFHGGFVGVDVFFVISGYLITRIILRDADAGAFSFARFYVRRTRRIFPALIFTVAVTYMAGALWCSPLMFLDIAKECTHALLSIANIQYWRESHKYFAPNSDQLALLHCWSLSVEEQFYLAWPAFVVLAKRFNRVREAVAFATVASFLCAVLEANRDPTAVFFLTPFRIYEFGCGALVLFAEGRPIQRRLREAVSASGIIAIVASAVTFQPDTPHLEIAMLLPCLGASAVILAGSNTAAARLITLPAFMTLGSISYSLYLCHWPIIFFARFIYGDNANSPAATAMIALAMLATALAMFAFIERPFIQSPVNKTAGFKRTAIQFWSVILLLVAITHATFLSQGFAWRVPPQQKELARMQDYPGAADMALLEGPASLYLVGDSHAIQYEVGLSALLHRLHANMEILASPGCPILVGVSLIKSSFRDGCIAVRDRVLERVKATTLPIVFDQSWSLYDDTKIDDGRADEGGASSPSAVSYIKLRSALERTMAAFVKGGRRVLLIGAQVNADCHFDRARLYQGPLPHAPLPPCRPGTKEQAERSGADINDMLARIQSRWPDNITLLRPVDYLCDSECPTMNDGLWLYFDPTHFSVAGSHYMVERATTPLSRFLFPH